MHTLPVEHAIDVRHLRRVYKTTLGIVRRKTKEVVAVAAAQM